MVCTAYDLLGWRDFPKGLRVLVLDEDSSSAAEIRSKLEEMDYIVSMFHNKNEALSAISNKPEGFHIAIVEVSTSNSNGRFEFLEVVKDLPTIMTSKMQCLTTMMKCIALGAVEFLLKPLSDDKLRNIWQHVVHKAFNAGGKDPSESLKPIKESMVSMLHLQLENGEPKSSISAETEHEAAVEENDQEKSARSDEYPVPLTPQLKQGAVKESVVSMLHLQLENGEPKSSISAETEHEAAVEENDQEQSARSDEYPAPPTPQLKQGVRLVDDGECQDQTNCSAEKDVESKSVDNTCGNVVAESTVEASTPQLLGETVISEEDVSPDGCRSDSMSSCPQNKDGPNDSGGDAENPIKASGLHNSCGNKANRKKRKVDWTPELHRKFVQAVEKLGVDQAIPSRILELMKVEGLTRHNIASHLQKYRMQRRHIVPKENGRVWPHPRHPSQRSYYSHKPVMAFPAYNSNPTLPAGQVYPSWGPAGSYLASVQTWGPAFYSPWQPAERWHWKPYPGMHVDAWGCPAMPPPPHEPHWSFSQNAAGFHSANTTRSSYGMPQNSFDLHPAEEEIDKVVKEAITKPWLPLPIGLRPPSTDGVLTELSKQGISTIPPHINTTHLH